MPNVALEHWFPVNVNFFVACILMQINKYSYCFLICELSYTNPQLSSVSENKVTTQGTSVNWQCSLAADTSVIQLLKWTSYALISHSQRAELISAITSTEKHYNRRTVYHSTRFYSQITVLSVATKNSMYLYINHFVFQTSRISKGFLIQYFL